MNSDDDLRPFFGDFDLHGNEPAPPQQVEKLVSEVAKKLKIGPNRRAECEAAIRSQFRAAKASGEHGKKIPSPRKIKDTAGAISSSLRKAKIAMARIDEFYASLWPDVDPEQRYDDFGRLIEKAIKVADALDRGMIISDESRPRDINKYSSKTAAKFLISKFAEDADRTERSVTRLENAIARMFYKALTGERAGDLVGKIAEFRPVPIKARYGFTRQN